METTYEWTDSPFASELTEGHGESWGETGWEAAESSGGRWSEELEGPADLESVAWEDDGHARTEFEEAFEEEEEEELDEFEDESPFATGSSTQATGAVDTEAPRGDRPLLKRGSRGEAVSRAQRLLNRFLPTVVGGPAPCVDRSPGRVAEMGGRLRVLNQNRQLPLVVDGKFGPNTEHATLLFQACVGLARDGKIGPVTWHYLERSGKPRRPNPRDTAGCGVPDRPSSELERELDLEREMLDEAPRRSAPAVRARLSLFQNSSTSSHRNHFHCQATRIARLLRAYANPQVDRCAPRRVGPTSFDTGADIIRAISAANSCLNSRLTAVHIVGHSGSYGAFGATSGSDGLYITANASDRATGARSIVDIPVAALANDVVFVLHGCNQAAGTDSFAEELYRHLATTLTAAKVFAHPNGGCAGRDNSWRRYDSRSPAGRRVQSIAPYYSGSGCCSPARSEFREEFEQTHEPVGEWEHEYQSGDRQPCGCGR